MARRVGEVTPCFNETKAVQHQEHIRLNESRTMLNEPFESYFLDVSNRSTNEAFNIL